MERAMRPAAAWTPCTSSVRIPVSTRWPVPTAFRTRQHRRRPEISLRAQAADPSEDDKRRAVEEAMQNPEVRARMEAFESQMADPGMQQQMAQMQAVMQNPQIMQRMAELREDPELKPMFEQIQTGGLAALQKAMSDPAFLGKIGEKLGDVDSLVAPPPTAASAASAAQAPPPEINSILDAAKHGDTEAIEDFLAIGKDVNAADDQGRTALHYAVAYQQEQVVEDLITAGADLERADTTGHTPLHYAAGYGRGKYVRRLLDAGANGAAVNESKQTPYDMVDAEPRNPLHGDAEIKGLLQAAAGAA